MKIVDTRTKPSCIFKCSIQIALDKKVGVNIKDKMYLKTYYHHKTGQV
jgi:hypothetical protein